MCIDPVSMAIIGGVTSAAGTAFSAISSARSYKAQAAAQDRQAEIERQKGAYESKRQENSNTRQLANMRGSYLSSGIGLSGSAVDVIADSATEASLDEQAIRYGSKIRSDNYTMEAKMSRMNAGQALAGGAFGVLSDTVNTFSGVSKLKRERTMIMNPYGAM